MPKLKIKKGDNVVVISGRDKGKRGQVLRVGAVALIVRARSGVDSRARRAGAW